MNQLKYQPMYSRKPSRGSSDAYLVDGMHDQTRLYAHRGSVARVDPINHKGTVVISSRFVLSIALRQRMILTSPPLVR